MTNDVITAGEFWSKDGFDRTQYLKGLDEAGKEKHLEVLSDNMKIDIPFAGEKQSFRLTLEMISELEECTGLGIGALYQRVISSVANASEIVNIIKFGLMGGGADPKRAADMIERFIPITPINNLSDVAFTIMNVAMYGKEKALALEAEA